MNYQTALNKLRGREKPLWISEPLSTNCEGKKANMNLKNPLSRIATKNFMIKSSSHSGYSTIALKLQAVVWIGKEGREAMNYQTTLKKLWGRRETTMNLKNRSQQIARERKQTWISRTTLKPAITMPAIYFFYEKDQVPHSGISESRKRGGGNKRESNELSNRSQEITRERETTMNLKPLSSNCEGKKQTRISYPPLKDLPRTKQKSLAWSNQRSRIIQRH